MELISKFIAKRLNLNKERDIEGHSPDSYPNSKRYASSFGI